MANNRAAIFTSGLALSLTFFASAGCGLHNVPLDTVDHWDKGTPEQRFSKQPKYAYDHSIYSHQMADLAKTGKTEELRQLIKERSRNSFTGVANFIFEVVVNGSIKEKNQDLYATAIHFIDKEPNVKAFRTFLDAGLDVNTVVPGYKIENDTFLAKAVRNNNPEMVEMLRKRGADAHALNDLALREADGNDRMTLLLGGVLPGTTVADGTIYAGFSPNTERALYTTREDAPGTYNWTAAVAYCQSLTTGNHNDWRLPAGHDGYTYGYDPGAFTPVRETVKLFNNRAAIGNFNLKPGPDAPNRYWSAGQISKWEDMQGNSSYVDTLTFEANDYKIGWDKKDSQNTVRCVRSGPAPK